MNIHPDTFYDAEKKVWSGPKAKDIFGPDMTLGEIALVTYGRVPADKVVQVMDSTGEELTAAELIRNSKVVAWNLQRLGLKVGDVVGICADNTTHLTAVLIGALLCGTPINSLFPEFDKDDINLIYKLTTPKIVFCDVKNYTTVKEAMDELKSRVEIFLVNGELQGIRNVKELLIYGGHDLENEIFPCSKLTGEDTAFILCTSGSTGPAKGVVYTHSYLIRRPAIRYMPADSVVFSFSTMYWGTAVIIFELALLFGIKRVITDKPFTPEYFVELVEKHRITDIIMVTNHLVKIVQETPANIEKRLDSVRVIMVGGSKVPPMASEGMNIILGNKPRAALTIVYGTSETAVVSLNFAGPGKRRENSEGKLILQTEVCIVDENGQRLGPNEQGTLHICLPFKFHGYYRNPEATQNAFLNGWYNTGDLAFFDDDGYLHVLTRQSDIFKCSNFQIHPQQIEEHLLRVPGVSEACVFGIPDLQTGNLLACAIVRANNEEGRKLTAAGVELYVKNTLARYYHIMGGVYFVDALPKTPTDKRIRRKVLETVRKSVSYKEKEAQ